MRPGVWAPRAERVDLVVVDGGEHRMTRGDDGWHRADIDLPHGTRYWFQLDGGPSRADPRSHWQPDGIDGPSAVVDHDAFAWSDAGWRGVELAGAVVYELHVGTFTAPGTFVAATERLDHLADLGVAAVEVMPIAEAMGTRGWGYDGVFLYAPHHAYGGPDGFKEFVDACHARGIGVVLDVVYNHLGPRGSHLDDFGPYFSDAHETGWGRAVNLDGEGSAAVRRFVLDNARHWFLDHHVDGLRLDATHALLDDSRVHLLAELAAERDVLAGTLGRRLLLIAEREQNELLPTEPRDAGGWGLDARWADDLHHALHAALTGETDGYYKPFGLLADVAAAVESVHVAGGDPVPAEVSGDRFVVCAQNHDQVGNRAGGERLHHLAGTDAALAAAAVVLCSPYVPLLFAGEEWCASAPFPYFCDPGEGEADLAAAITTGRRDEFAAFGWDPDAVPDPVAPTTARAAVLDWEEVEAEDGEHATALAWYRTVLRLRRNRPDVADPRRDAAHLRTWVDEDAGIFVLVRAATAVVVNTSGDGRSVAAAVLRFDEIEVLAATGAVRIEGDGSVTVGPRVTAIVGRPYDWRSET